MHYEHKVKDKQGVLDEEAGSHHTTTTIILSSSALQKLAKPLARRQFPAPCDSPLRAYTAGYI
jgi:hypothetical protein